MAKYKCPKCEQIFEGPASFCPYCGARVIIPKVVTMKCPICGGTHIKEVDISYHVNGQEAVFIAPFNTPVVKHYACLDCGHIIDMIDPSDLQKVRNKYDK